jgi:hypothetical protein
MWKTSLWPDLHENVYKNSRLKNSCCVYVTTILKAPESSYPELYTQRGQKLKIPNSLMPLMEESRKKENDAAHPNNHVRVTLRVSPEFILSEP